MEGVGSRSRKKSLLCVVGRVGVWLLAILKTCELWLEHLEVVIVYLLEVVRMMLAAEAGMMLEEAVGEAHSHTAGGLLFSGAVGLVDCRDSRDTLSGCLHQGPTWVSRSRSSRSDRLAPLESSARNPMLGIVRVEAYPAGPWAEAGVDTACRRVEALCVMNVGRRCVKSVPAVKM